MTSSFTRFLDHTQRRITVGRTPLDEWSARRRDPHLTTHNTQHSHPCSRRDSNPQSQQASGRRPTPQTARPLGTAVLINWGSQMSSSRDIVLCLSAAPKKSISYRITPQVGWPNAMRRQQRPTCTAVANSTDGLNQANSCFLQLRPFY